ncbi:MAG: hypothetical protein J7L77_08135 [Clostridiales bacterium]|nr:hypothetical protein [Clostridiales bacterium]
MSSWSDIFDFDTLSLDEAGIKLLEIISDYQGCSGNRVFVLFNTFELPVNLLAGSSID